jgi:hypothetical protein
MGSQWPDRRSLLLKDCWLGEVMPPTWTWACNRLLTLGEDRPGFGKRIA